MSLKASKCVFCWFNCFFCVDYFSRINIWGFFLEQVVLSQFHESLDQFLVFFFSFFHLVLFCFDMLKVTGSVIVTQLLPRACV